MGQLADDGLEHADIEPVQCWRAILLGAVS